MAILTTQTTLAVSLLPTQVVTWYTKSEFKTKDYNFSSNVRWARDCTLHYHTLCRQTGQQVFKACNLSSEEAKVQGVKVLGPAWAMSTKKTPYIGREEGREKGKKMHSISVGCPRALSRNHVRRRGGMSTEFPNFLSSLRFPCLLHSEIITTVSPRR